MSSSSSKVRSAQVQKWPGEYAIAASLKNYELMPFEDIGDRLNWLLGVWPGCAISVVHNAHELSHDRAEKVRKWGEVNLRPGNYDTTGLHQ